MANPLRKMRISARIYLLIAVAVLGMGGVFQYSMMHMQEALFKERSESTRRIVEETESLLVDVVKKGQASGKSLEDAKKAALEEIRNIRYDGKEYVWVNDLDGKMLMHPLKPELNGKDILGIKDADGDNIFAEMIAIVKKDGKGSYSYFWPPDSTAKEKISYVSGIQEFGWVVGTGVYVEDVEKAIWTVEKETGAVVVIIALIVFPMLDRTQVRD